MSSGRSCGRIGGLVPLLLILLLVPSCSRMTRHPAPESGLLRVEVRVTWREAPLPGAQVEWYTGIGDPIRTPAAVRLAGEDGIASCTLPPGRYYLFARWRRDGDFSRPNAPGDRFAYFGGNPVYLHAGSAEEIHLGLEEVYPAPSPLSGEPEGTGVAGVVTGVDGPVEGAHVFAYTRTGSGFRDLGFAASPPTDEKGAFRIDMPPGVYYLVARKRASGGLAGPLRKGDFFGWFPDNPVTVERDRVIRVAIPATRLKLRNLPAYSRDYAAAASIEGRILDRQGNPRRGVYAALYDNPDLLNRPLFLSDVTGPDGTFRLSVPLPGRYYLGARSGYGGSPGPGDLYGRFEGTPDHAIVVRDGDRLTGVDIVVREVW